MKVVLDTNACLLPFTERFDVARHIEIAIGEAELIVPAVVRMELTTLSHNGGKIGRAAAGALRMFENATNIKNSLPGDDGLMEICEAEGAMLVTNDRILLAEAKARGIPTLRKRANRLATTGVAGRRP